MVEDMESAATQHFPYKTSLSQMLLKDTPLPLSEAATPRQPAIMPVSSAPLPVALPDRLKDPGKQASGRRSPKKGKRDVEGVQADTCKQLKDLPVHGLILNQVASRIPAWLRQIL